jgi:hypothetical protein
MEIAIFGQGEVVIRFIDGHGQTLLQERLVVSGPSGVQALRYVPLSIGTVDGPADLAPVLTSLSNSKQRVTFDGEKPARFTQRRCKAIGCSATVSRDAARGRVPAPTHRGASPEPEARVLRGGFTTVGEPAMDDVLRAASGRVRGRR